MNFGAKTVSPLPKRLFFMRSRKISLVVEEIPKI